MSPGKFADDAMKPKQNSFYSGRMAQHPTPTRRPKHVACPKHCIFQPSAFCLLCLAHTCFVLLLQLLPMCIGKHLLLLLTEKNKGTL